MSKKTASSNLEAIRRGINAQEGLAVIRSIMLNENEPTANRLRAAEIWLKKCLPDLSAVTVDTGPEGINVNINKFVS